MGCCFPYCFLEIFVGGQGLDEGGQSRDGGSPTHQGKSRGGDKQTSTMGRINFQTDYFDLKQETIEI